jgi:hypothetical protein
MGNEEPEKLTDDEPIKLSKSGNSHVLLIPANWLKTFRQLTTEPRIYYAHLERDSTGKLLLVFEKARTESAPQPVPNGGENHR